jgi:hypothetical protein
MFNDKFTKIGDEIYVYKNFVSKEELEEINSLILSLNESDWYEENKDIKWMLRTENKKILEPIRERIVSVVDSELTVGSNTVFVKMKKGYSWGVHEDDYEFRDVIEKSKNYKDGDPFDIVDVSVYGIVIYFNNFDGGQLYYPEQNLEYKPEPGDMVIHGSGFNCRHGVREILSDVRYSHSNHISKKIKIPKE